MISGAGFGRNQITIGDLIVAVMDAALATVQDEDMASEIASRVLVNVLETVSPNAAQEILAVFGEKEVN